MLDQDSLNGYDSITASLSNVPLLMPLTSVYGALYLGKDFADRTLYSAICAGHTRSHIFFSKALVFIAGSNLILLVQPVLIISLNTWIHGWGHLSFESDFKYLISLLLITAVLNAAMCAVSLLIAFSCRDVGRTLTIPALIYFLTIFLLNGPQAHKIARFIPLGQLRLVIGSSSSSGAALLTGGSVLLLFCLAAAWLFNRAELT